MPKAIDLTGQRFGRLVVVKIDHKDKRKDGKGSVVYWQCLCDCGNIVYIPTGHLKSGNTKSCGCLRTELAKELFVKHCEKNAFEGTLIDRINLNKQPLKNNKTSGVCGVDWNRKRNKWRAQIGFRGKVIFLGRFETKEEAAEARKAAEEKYFKPVLEEYENQNEGAKNEKGLSKLSKKKWKIVQQIQRND